jgi:hypothetical protein
LRRADAGAVTPAQARHASGGGKASGVLSEFAKSVKSGLERRAARATPPPAAAPRRCAATATAPHLRVGPAHALCTLLAVRALRPMRAAADAAPAFARVRRNRNRRVGAQQPGAQAPVGRAEEEHRRPGGEVRCRAPLAAAPIGARAARR